MAIDMVETLSGFGLLSIISGHHELSKKVRGRLGVLSSD